MTDSGTASRSVWSAPVLVVYLAGFVQGLVLVSFPAVSTVLKQTHGFTDAQYGAIFLPQVAFAVAGAVGGGTLAKRLGLRRLLVWALLANCVSMALLATTAWLPASLAFPAVLAGTAALGLGFGLLGAPINAYPPILFPGKPDSALVAVHTLIGLGLSTGPLIASQFNASGLWMGFPILLAALTVALAAWVQGTDLPVEEGAAEDDRKEAAGEAGPLTAPLFWMFGAIAVLYAFAEGTFANWATIYLHEAKGLSEATGNLAISVFWAAMVVGRLTVSALVARIPSAVIWPVLPALMIAGFLLMPLADSATTGIGLFALAGIACSAFFPLTIALISQAFPRHVAWVSSMMIAALMIGVGAGSFIIGALRQVLSMEDLYILSALYPLAVLVLAIPVLRSRRRRAAGQPASAVAE